jgi:hypothetical protein
VPLAGASGRGAVAGVVRPEAARGEPDDVGVDRDLDDGVAVVLPAAAGAGGEGAGQGLVPGAGGELAHALPLAGDLGSAAQGLVYGVGGADGGLGFVLLVVVQLGEVAALGAEDLRERADVELAAWVRAEGPIQSR